MSVAWDAKQTSQNTYTHNTVKQYKTYTYVQLYDILYCQILLHIDHFFTI